MKKILIALGVILFVGVSCTGTKKGFTLSGVAPEGASESMAYLLDNNGNPVDSAEIKDGAFVFNGDEDLTKTLIVSVGEKRTRLIPERGDLTLNFTDSIPAVKGSTLNDKYVNYMLELNNALAPLSQKVMDLHTQALNNPLTKEQMEEYGSLMDTIHTVNQGLFKASYAVEKENILGALLLEDATYMGVFDTDSVFEQYYNEGSDVVKNTETLKNKMALIAKVKETSKGGTYVDFECVNPKDTTEVMKLSDFVGKTDYVLVDFWASWCGPCKALMPGLKELYKKYHTKGLEIVGVTVWDELENNLKEQEKQQLPWPQLYDKTKKDVADAYGIQGIPTTILLDKEGKILFRGHGGVEEIIDGLFQGK